jgi:uncharacterized protein (TIRG00374 family)
VIDKRRFAARALIRLLGPALLLLVLVRIKDRGAVLHALAQAAWAPMLAATLLNLVNVHLKVVRWQQILEARNIRYPLRRAWPAFMSSVYLGMLTPGRVGDVLRIQYLRHDLDVPYAEGLASIVVDRLCDLYVLALFVAVGVVHYSPVIVGQLAWITWSGVAAIVIGPLVFLVPGVAERTLGRVYARLAKGKADDFGVFLAAVRANMGRPLLRTLPMTALAFGVNYVQGYVIAHAMGLDMSFFDAVCLLAIASLLGLLPISVSGVGVRELFFSLVFPLLGFTPAAGVTFGLLVFFVIYLINIGIGFVSFQLAPPPSAKKATPPAG